MKTSQTLSAVSSDSDDDENKKIVEKHLNDISTEEIEISAKKNTAAEV